MCRDTNVRSDEGTTATKNNVSIRVKEIGAGAQPNDGKVVDLGALNANL